MKIQRGILSVLGITTLAAFTGCEAPRERRVVVSQPPPVIRERVRSRVTVVRPPPPPIEEAIPKSPGARYVWTPGYWTWDGHWVWQSGRWMKAPNERAFWRPGHWIERDGEWYWQAGYWR